MSTTEWVSVKSKSKSNMANIKLSEMVKNDDLCYYCLVNKCRNNNHDRRNTKLKRCKNYFKDLINNPCNLSTDFSDAFNKAIEKNLLKKYKINKSKFYITTCTSPLINKRCYNERDGNTFDFKHKGKTFTACHKNPENISGKLPICLHCDFTRVNRKVDIIPVKKMETTRKVESKKRDVIPEKKEEIKKETDPNSWAGRLNKLDEHKEEEIKDFFNKVTPFKKSISFNINEEQKNDVEQQNVEQKNDVEQQNVEQQNVEQQNDVKQKNDVLQQNEELSLEKLEKFENDNKDLLNDEQLKKLEKENELLKKFICDKKDEKSFSMFKEIELLKRFICNKYDEDSFSNFSQSFHKEESTKLEKLMIKKHSSKNKLIDIWHKDNGNKLITVST
jgi:hypothetical protein